MRTAISSHRATHASWILLVVLIVPARFSTAADNVGPTPAPANLTVVAQAEFDAATAALAEAKAAVLRDLAANDAKYQAARADLDKWSAVKEHGKVSADVTPKQRLEADSGYNLAKRAVEKLEFAAVTSSPAVQSVMLRVDVARRAMALVAQQHESDESKQARLEQIISRMTPGQLSLAQRLAAGALPDLPADHLEIGSAGQLMLPVNVLPANADRHQIPATVVQVMTPDNMLVSMLGQWVWLAGCPTKGMREGKSIAVAGCYAVSRSQTVQIGSVQRAVLVLEPVNVDQLKEVAEYLKTEPVVASGADAGDSNASAPTPAARPGATKGSGYRTRTYTSVAQIFAMVPYPYQVEARDQLTGLRGEMRTKWLADNMPGALLDTTVHFDSADIGGTFQGVEAFKELGVEHRVTIYADFKQEQAVKLSAFKQGDAMRVHGRIIRMSDSDIRLTDFTFQRLINPAVNLGGGTIHLGGADRNSSHANDQGGILSQRQGNSQD